MSSSGWVINAPPEVNAQSQYPLIIGICVSLSALMVIVVGLRVYTRLKLVRAFGADDTVIIFSAVCSIVYSGLCITQSRLGLGLPLILRPKENLNDYTVVNFAGRPFYMAGITGFKVALCIAYLRISNHSSLRSYRLFIWSLMTFTILTHFAGTLVLIFQCKPVQKSWLPMTQGTCLPNDITFYALAAVTILCDVVVFLTPIPLLLRLRINRRKKIALIGIFLLGLFTTACSVMRMVQIIQISKDGNSTGLVLWGTIEMNVGISLTCLPTLSPLFTFFRSDTAIHYRYRSDGSGRGTAGGRNSKRRSNIPTALANLSVGGASTTVGSGRRSHLPHPKGASGSDASSQETILPLHNPDKTLEDGYILRSVDIEVTSNSPAPPLPGSEVPRPPAAHVSEWPMKALD